MLPEYQAIEQKQKLFPQYHRIETVAEFEKWYSQQSASNTKTYFRGVKEAKFKNFTSAQRYCLNHNIQELPLNIVNKEIQILRQNNDNLFEKYCVTTDIECTDIWLMSMAQHYGGISLFLDFSTNINTALFFTCQTTPQRKFDNTSKNTIDNYSSLYYSSQFGVPFEQIVADISNKCDFSEKNDNRGVFQKSALYTFNTFLSLGVFKILWGSSSPIMIENKPYPLEFSHSEYTFSRNIIVSNMNIVSQDGCLLYYDDECNPLEKDLSCVDINKSLIPYIKRAHLWPNKKTKKRLFPSVNIIVKNQAMSSIVK